MKYNNYIKHQVKFVYSSANKMAFKTSNKTIGEPLY